MEFIDFLVKKDCGNSCNDLIYLPSNDEYKRSDIYDGRTDYVVACGHEARIYKERYIALRNSRNDKVRKYGGELVAMEASETQNLLQPGLQISAMAFLKDSKENKEALGAYEITSSKERATIMFEKLLFPQNLSDYSDELEKTFNKYPERFTRTGKTYSGWRLDDDSLSQNEEFKYSGNLYVRVKAKGKDGTSRSFAQQKGNILCKSGDYYWFEVRPIKFNIENWNSLPSYINPNGNGRSEVMQLHASNAILTGIPFYPTNSDNKWQNSLIRAYFNGYDIQKELSSWNGEEDKAASINFDFSEKGLFDEMFSSDYAIPKKVTQKATEPKKRKNPFNVTVNDAPLSVKEQMKFYIREGKSFMLHGPSGVGKTRRVQELDPDCVCVQLRNGILPEEIIGKTGFEGGKSVWIEPTWYTRICEVCKNDPIHNHVLFIDEITNVNANEQSLVFHLVLSRSIDGNIGKLPDNCVVVAAGNTPEESVAAYNMPEPLFRRFEAHIQLQPDLKSFLEWGSELKPDGNPKIHPLIAAFVAANEKKVFYTKYDPDKPPKFAIDPRGWEQVSGIIYANKGELRLKMLADKIGEDNAVALIKFAQTPFLSFTDILEGNFEMSDIPKSAAEKYMLICSLRGVDEKNVAKVREFIKEFLGRENLEIFDSLWIEDNDERALLINQLIEEEKTAKPKGKGYIDRFKNIKTSLEQEHDLMYDDFEAFTQTDLYRHIIDDL